MLKGKRVLITAGPTREAIDPVRYISNHSTGKMGYAIADELYARGAEVILVSGPVNIASAIPCHNIINVTTADEMLMACKAQFDSLDIAIFCAAVADFKPEFTANHKIKKDDSELILRLIPNPDIAVEFSVLKRADQIAIGFALETDNVLKNARVKLLKKKLDFIVINSPNRSGSGFGYDTNRIDILNENGNHVCYTLRSKKAVACDIIDYLQQNFMLTHA